MRGWVEISDEIQAKIDAGTYEPSIAATIEAAHILLSHRKINKVQALELLSGTKRPETESEKPAEDHGQETQGAEKSS